MQISDAWKAQKRGSYIRGQETIICDTTPFFMSAFSNCVITTFPRPLAQLHLFRGYNSETKRNRKMLLYDTLTFVQYSNKGLQSAIT